MSIGIGAETQYSYPGPDPRRFEAQAPAEGVHCSPEHGCITCGDVALPLEIVEIDGDRGLALCRDPEGRTETVETLLVLPVELGDSLLVHAGTAISHLGREGSP